MISYFSSECSMESIHNFFVSFSKSATAREFKIFRSNCIKPTQKSDINPNKILNMAISFKYTNNTPSQPTSNINHPSNSQSVGLSINQLIQPKILHVHPNTESPTTEKISSPPAPKSNILIVDSQYSPPPIIDVDKFSHEPFDPNTIYRKEYDIPKIHTFQEDDDSVLTEFVFEPVRKSRQPRVHIPELSANEPSKSFTITPPNVCLPESAKTPRRKPRASKAQKAKVRSLMSPGQISSFTNSDIQMMAHAFGMSPTELKRIISNSNARAAASQGFVPGFMPQMQSHFLGPMQ